MAQRISRKTRLDLHVDWAAERATAKLGVPEAGLEEPSAQFSYRKARRCVIALVDIEQVVVCQLVPRLPEQELIEVDGVLWRDAFGVPRPKYVDAKHAYIGDDIAGLAVYYILEVMRAVIPI